MNDFKKQVIQLKNQIKKNFIQQDEGELNISRFSDDVIKEAISDYYLRSKLNMRLEDGVLHIDDKESEKSEFMEQKG